MKVLDVPTVSTTEVKNSPVKIAQMAAKLNTGVYVLNRGKALSVTLTPDQYKELVEAQERLLDLESELKARRRIDKDDGSRLTDEDVTGHKITDQIDNGDGWE
jgi:hypothetical protein